MNDLIDFGCDIKFSFSKGTGAYTPFALSTEKLDTSEKQMQFSHGFWSMAEAGQMKAQMVFSLRLGRAGNCHSFLHEVMHFYQDMYGLYLIPIKETGVFPICLDLKSTIIGLLFCEAWAETEAIRTCWSLKNKGNDTGWRGAITSHDWKALAVAYDKDLQDGIDEAKAAANTMERWYKGSHRLFYEKHAARIYDLNISRFTVDIPDFPDPQYSANFRALEVDQLFQRLPQDMLPKYLPYLDWTSDLFAQPRSLDVKAKIEEFEQLYGSVDDSDIQDIKCGSPVYLWKRLRMAETENSEVPPPPNAHAS